MNVTYGKTIYHLEPYVADTPESSMYTSYRRSYRKGKAKEREGKAKLMSIKNTCPESCVVTYHLSALTLWLAAWPSTFPGFVKLIIGECPTNKVT